MYSQDNPSDTVYRPCPGEASNVQCEFNLNFHIVENRAAGCFVVDAGEVSWASPIFFPSVEAVIGILLGKFKNPERLMKTKCFGNAPRRRVYLIHPRTDNDFWGMRQTVKSVGAKAMMPDAALATLISLTPDDLGIQFFFCDENIEPINWDLPCDLVGLSGYSLHADRIAQISKTFRARGVPVALGGAFATMFSDTAAQYADYLFVGEAEHTWPRFLRAWLRDEAEPVYTQQEFVDMAASPPPDWSLIDAGNYLYLTVQTSRGCPNSCDFCDVAKLVGRRNRKKSLDSILAEIQNAYTAGAHTVFFSDDNFMVNEEFTTELLHRIVAWNTAQLHPLSFSCQTSIRIADSDELLRLMADARFSAAFMGIESTRQKCLEEVNKGQLFRPDLVAKITRMSNFGILPFVGMIVGFDNDDEHTFTEIEQFLNDSGTPIASVSVLNAPRNTPLYDRLAKQGRIVEEYRGEWHSFTNIVPAGMSVEQVAQNHASLFARIYEPEAFERRTTAWMSNVTYHSALYKNRKLSAQKMRNGLHFFFYCTFLASPAVRRMFFRLLRKTWTLDKRLIKKVITIVSQYVHYVDFAEELGRQVIASKIQASPPERAN
jgi:radical SAM superfamily enzyme YgiQ (UPF0313 family)